MRRFVLISLTVSLLILCGVLVWLKLGGRAQPDYLSKREVLSSLFRKARQTGGLSPSEMDVIQRMLNDPNEFIRVRALTALFPVRDPSQRQVAIQMAIGKLKDPSWLVRIYALRVLRNLGAKEAVSQILPFLNDPQPEVREEAKKALQRLGYQVRE